MRLAYLDTSAATKLIIEEAESSALVEALSTERRLVAAWLVHTELHCAAGLHPDAVDITAVNQVLDAVNLADVTRGDLVTTSAHSPLRSNDAIHLAVALRFGVDEMVTYDHELVFAARRVVFSILTPGRDGHV